MYARKIRHIHKADVCMYIKIELSWDVLQIVPYLGHSAINYNYYSRFRITTADKIRPSTEFPVYSAI